MAQLDAAAGLASLSIHESGSTVNTDSGSLLGGSSGQAYAPGSRKRSATPPAATQKAEQAKQAFGELLPMVSPTQLVAGDDPDAEAEHWSIFADVFEEEVRHQEELVGAELQLEQRRQILADILVWAEVTQSRYDSDTASFVTEPHEEDASFRRIGELFKAAKAQRGLCR